MKASIALAGILAGFLARLASSTPLNLIPRDSCGDTLQTCSPPGAKSSTLPALGSGLSDLYVSLLDSIKGIHFKSRDVEQPVKRDGPSFCCAQGTSCLTLSTYAVPFCYDKFTTNYVISDGSSGQIVSGNYTAADGSTANLLTGAYTNSSSTTTTGNIYASDPAAKPNTATLSIPPQYTASGVGSAIPLTDLGTVVFTSTVAETALTSITIIPALTIPATTIPGTTVDGLTTRAATTVSATTIPASTVTMPSTLSAHETVLTSTSASAAASGSAASASPSHTGAAAAVRVGAGPVALLGGAAAYAFWAL